METTKWQYVNLDLQRPKIVKKINSFDDVIHIMMMMVDPVTGWTEFS